MLKKQLNIDISGIIFLLTFVFGILFYFLGFEGLLFSDDYSYAEKANLILLKELYPANDIMEHRFGMLLPVAMLYSLFGINDYTTTFFPLLCFLGVLIVIYIYFRRMPVIAAIAMILVSLNYYSIYFSNRLFPDVPLSFFSLVSLLFLLERSSSKVWVTAIGFVLTFFYGFLVKETIIYLLPFFLFICIKDFINKGNLKFWIIVTVVFILLFGGYFLVYYFFTGDAFYRFKVIMDGHYVSGGSYYDKSFAVLLKRITYEPLLMLIASELFIPIIIGIFLLLQWKTLLEKEKYWLSAALFCLSIFWLGSTSLRVYNPIVLNPRMFILLVPIWSIVAAYSFQRALTKPILIRNYILSFSIAALICYFYFNNIKLTAVYIVVVLFFVLIYVVVIHKWFKPFMIVGLFFILLLHPMYILWNNDSKNNYNTLKFVFQDYFVNNKKHKVVLTDPITQYGYKYFYQFKDLSYLKVYSYLELDKFMKDGSDDKYVLLQGEHIQELMIAGDPVPVVFTSPPDNWNVLMKKEEVALYRVR